MQKIEAMNPRALSAIIILTALLAGVAGFTIGRVLERPAPSAGTRRSLWWIVATPERDLHARAFFLGPYVTHALCDADRGILRAKGECRYVTIQNLQRERAREWWGVATLHYFPKDPKSIFPLKDYDLGQAGPYPTEEACAAALAELETATTNPIERESPFAAVIGRSECLPQRTSF